MRGLEYASQVICQFLDVRRISITDEYVAQWINGVDKITWVASGGHRQQITPDRENPVDRRYWRSKLDAKLHTDGPRFGIPPSALFMLCEHPPAEGGDVELLDLWPLIEQIRVAENVLRSQGRGAWPVCGRRG